jgi:hypothetical protein
MRDDDRVKEEIGFYNPAAWADEDGNPVINENHWKLWKMYAADLAVGSPCPPPLHGNAQGFMPLG